MDLRSVLAEIEALCAEHLGEDLGARLAALAEPGFVLEPAHGDVVPTGRCRVGGPALLEPGTPWPETEGGFPLTLVAVLDTSELASLPGHRFPARSGLVNVFWLQPDFRYEGDSRFAELLKPYEHWWGRRDRPDECRIVLADPAEAAEVAAPPPARTLHPRALKAVPFVTLPSFTGEARDPIWETLDLRIPPDSDEYGWEPFLGMGLLRDWLDFCRREFGYRPGDSQAFGWPSIDQWVGKRGEGYAHLLTLSGNLWDDDHDGGFERIMVSPDGLRNGEFGDVAYEQDGLH